MEMINLLLHQKLQNKSTDHAQRRSRLFKVVVLTSGFGITFLLKRCLHGRSVHRINLKHE